MSTDVLGRIESIKEELRHLGTEIRGTDVRMGGRLEGARFDKEDFEDAEKSLFGET